MNFTPTIFCYFDRGDKEKFIIDIQFPFFCSVFCSFFLSPREILSDRLLCTITLKVWDSSWAAGVRAARRAYPPGSKKKWATEIRPRIFNGNRWIDTQTNASSKIKRKLIFCSTFQCAREKCSCCCCCFFLCQRNSHPNSKSKRRKK